MVHLIRGEIMSTTKKNTRNIQTDVPTMTMTEAHDTTKINVVQTKQDRAGQLADERTRRHIAEHTTINIALDFHGTTFDHRIAKYLFFLIDKGITYSHPYIDRNKILEELSNSTVSTSRKLLLYNKLQP